MASTFHGRIQFFFQIQFNIKSDFNQPLNELTTKNVFFTSIN